MHPIFGPTPKLARGKAMGLTVPNFNKRQVAEKSIVYNKAIEEKISTF